MQQLKVGEQFIVSEFKPIAEMQLYNQEMLRKPFMLSVVWKVSRPGWHSSLHVEARSEGQPYHEDQQQMQVFRGILSS